MKIVVFGDERRLGALADGRVVDLNEAFRTWARDRGEEAEADGGRTRVPSDLCRFIEGGAAALVDAEQALAASSALDPGHRGPSGRPIVHDEGAVRLHAPWPGRRIACAGGNYPDHLARMLARTEGAAVTDLEETARRAREAGQWGFWKVVDEVAGPGDAVPKPRRAKLFDYEGEVAVILGARAKDVTAPDVEQMIWGVTLLNDWSIRSGMGRPRPMSYNLAKNFDGCVSMGPAIVVGELGAADVDVELRVNGELRQSFNSASMIFSFGEIVEELSRDLTLLPGDVVSGGTAAGTAADATEPSAGGEISLELFLKPGDVVELSSPGIGSMTNHIVEPGPR